jgi:hypothetical protein
MSQAVREPLTPEQFLRMPEVKPPPGFLRGRMAQKVAPNLLHSALAEEPFDWIAADD